MNESSEQPTTTKKDQIREAAEASLETFIRLVHPLRVLGSVHIEVIDWWTRPGAKSHQLLLLPRDHGKSALVAYRVAWEITKNPAIRILYVSSTNNLASKQLKFIKDILTSPIYQYYWPDMVHKEEGKREKWTEQEFSVDHPLRRKEAVRDPTVFTAGLTTSITGLHCDIAVLDDVVVDDNANNQEGRTKVANQASYLASIMGAEDRQWVVGTRYHPKDLYSDFISTTYEVYDENGNLEKEEELFEVFQREVEDKGDGTGEFLWPRQQRFDGKWFGFDRNILARKRSQYSDKAKFRAQYYNNPNLSGGSSFDPKDFQYYNPKLLTQDMQGWYYNGNKLNVSAAIDFAFSLKKRADYTCIVVVGVDSHHNYYILDIDRFKTQLISDYYDRMLRLHQKWGFRKLRAEISVAQEIIVKDLKDNYIRPNGLLLTINEHRPTRHMGTKEERIEAVLQPKYANKQIYHYIGGNCQTLEEELLQARPAHDDIKDCLSSAIEDAVPPSGGFMGGARSRPGRVRVNGQSYATSELTNKRFGGIG